MKKKYFIIILLLLATVFLSGCARKDPVDVVVGNHHQHIGEVLDYAKNNIEQTQDVIFLENELKQCDLALEDVKQVYLGQISTCNAEKTKWKVISGSLLLLLSALIFLKIRKVF